MGHLLISAAHKSSGKTTLTTGLCAALKNRDLTVQPFKKGPDYIDPLWLGAAACRACRNLDFHTQSHDEITRYFARHIQGADIGIIEGNKGLFDGVELDGQNSNAALARLLGAPVVLVIDTQGMTRGIAPLLKGYLDFEEGLNFAGIILNKVAGSRHEGKLRAVIEYYTDLEVIGAVGRRPEMEIAERHLGLVPSHEQSGAQKRIDAIAKVTANDIDLDKVIAAANQAVQPNFSHLHPLETRTPDITIGYSHDAAFNFYYQDDLDALARSGARLVPIDTLEDAALPPVDGLFLGGGFPETNMKTLEANSSLRSQIKTAIEAGLPCYAECGGLMYLARRIIWNDESAQMVGVLPADAVMYKQPRGRGYVILEETKNHPWPVLETMPEPLQHATHEFHYSHLENYDGEKTFAYKVRRGAGLDGVNDGIVYKNLLASYAHMRHVDDNPWTARFAEFVRKTKKCQNP
jgi:cobyrinic acid a,c-diamide synthase